MLHKSKLFFALALGIIGPGRDWALAAQPGKPAVALELIAGNLVNPVAITQVGDGSGRLFITLQAGKVVIYDGTQVLPAPFLDITALVSCCGERGLFSVAFHPKYASNGHFYVNYTNTSGDTVIARYTVASDPNVADPNSAVILLTITQPFANHNGGQLQFGPDGYLYIGMGDGGSRGDPGNRAQNLGELLGKMLRIDVDGGSPYAIPPTNPFRGTPGARDEIWALGLRNPWRFSFDRLTGDLFIADVGQATWEEVNFQPAASRGGENYGWRLMEGNHCFNPSTGCNDGSLTLPILEYDHSLGCSISGGYRYRGARFPRLYGTYLYADFCSGRVWGATQTGNGAWTTTELLDTPHSITTFGEDEAGELYLAHHGLPDSSTGAIYRVVDQVPTCGVRMSQASYVDGDRVTASSVRLTNSGAAQAPLELKIWLSRPEGPPVSVVNLGADGSAQLPAGFDQDFGPLGLFPVTAGTPRGSYGFNCRVLDPPTGELLTEDLNPFEVQ